MKDGVQMEGARDGLLCGGMRWWFCYSGIPGYPILPVILVEASMEDGVADECTLLMLHSTCILSKGVGGGRKIFPVSTFRYYHTGIFIYPYHSYQV